MTYRIDDNTKLVIEADTTAEALDELATVTADILKHISRHPGYQSADGWFSVSFEVAGQCLDEEAFFGNTPVDASAADRTNELQKVWPAE